MMTNPIFYILGSGFVSILIILNGVIIFLHNCYTCGVNATLVQF